MNLARSVGGVGGWWRRRTGGWVGCVDGVGWAELDGWDGVDGWGGRGWVGSGGRVGVDGWAGGMGWDGWFGGAGAGLLGGWGGGWCGVDQRQLSSDCSGRDCVVHTYVFEQHPNPPFL